MRTALLILGKDLRERFRDRSLFLVGFVVPFGLMFIFSLVLGPVTSGELELDYVVVDQDGGALGRVFVEQVLGSLARDGLAEIEESDDVEAAEQLVEDGEVDAVIVVPSGFTDAVASGAGASLEVVGNVDSTLGTQIARSVAQGFASELEATQRAVLTTLASGADHATAEELAERAAATAAPISLAEGAASDRQLDQTTYLAAGMAVFFLFFTVQYGVIGFLEERRIGTLSRLFSAPVPRWTVYAGKGLTSLVLGLVSMAVLLVAAALLLGANWGDPLGVIVLTVAGVFSAVGIVTVVTVFARTAEQAGTWQAVIAVALGMIGGVFFDVTRSSRLLALASLATPHQWYMRGLGSLQGDGSLVDALPAVAAITAFGVGALLIAAVVTRVREAAA